MKKPKPSLDENTLTDALDLEYDEDIDIKKIWEEAMTELRGKLSAPAYSNYLQSIHPLHLKGDELLLSAPSDFVKDWLVRRFGKQLKDTLEKLIGRRVSLLFELHPEDNVTVGISEKEKEVLPSIPKPKKKRKKVGIAQDIPGAEAFSTSPLNEKYTFDNFIVGRSNYISHAASMAVAKAPAKGQYNPLFIYGGVGLGKTHLMQAIGHHINGQNDKPMGIVYVSGENFLYQVVRCIREDRMTAFREMYRSVDVWLVDDIQYICNAERTEVEFFHIFNTLYDQGKQIVICSDKPPKELNLTESRLTSRFEWGLITYIDTPDLEHRIAILQRRAEEEGAHVDPEVLQFLAEKIRSNIRSLEGALTRILAISSLDGRKINLDLAAETVSYYSTFAVSSPAVKISTIIELTSDHFNISIGDILGKKRSKNVVLPRQIAMYLAREMSQMSYPDIGREFSRDYTTIIHSYEKIKEESRKDADLRQTISDLRSQIHSESREQ